MLTVVTEIDAVSLFHQRESGQYKQNTQSSHGKKFVIINAGDYSSSIVAHETTNEGIVKESTALETKEGGGSILKKTFKTFCTDVFDTDVFTTFKSESNREWWEMKTELFKKAFSYEPSGSNITRLKLPVILQESFKQYFCLHESSVKSKYPGRIYLLSDKICFDSEVLQAIIKPSVEQVISDIQNYLKTKDASVDEIVVFGEFTTLPMFTYEVENQFSEKKVIFYEDEKESALTGAGIIGLGLGQIEKIDRVANTAIVAAIDFGTTYSGWAYSLRSNFDSDRTKASTKLWNSGSAQTEKTPTCILIRPDGKTIEAFGYEAEDRYQDLAGTEEHMDFFYFRRFKMSLSKKLGEKLDRNMTLEDAMNRCLPAIDVFAMSIKFLKDDLLAVLPDRHLGNIKMDDIHWVLTVPAIWTDGSKQFMREAAIMAGIKSKRLTIALEPEAASMFCRNLPIEATNCDSGSNISSLSIGTQYMILDAGGGTIDITVHEVDTDNNVKEIHAASGGGWGGTTVDEAFKRLLVAIITNDVYEAFKKDHTDDWLDIWRDFEVKKRTITSSSNSPVRMRLPSSLTDKYYLVTKQKLAIAVKGSEYACDIQIVRDKINFSAELARSWFKTSVAKTVHLVESIMSKNENVTAILMVGGFSESPVLQNAVRAEFKQMDIIIPSEASNCILKGALIFGHLPKVITERVLKYTYGIGSFETFVAGHHPPKRLITTDNGFVCPNVFSKHAEIYQRVKIGEPQVWHSYSPQYKSQTQMSFSVFASEKPNPVYTDEGCILIGTLQIDLVDHDGALDREVLVAFTFSGTEIVVEAKDRKTGNQSFVAVDFLG